jgi:hypothetical protein
MIALSPLVAGLATIGPDDGWMEATLDPSAPDGDGWLSAAVIATSPDAVERLYAVARASTGPADDRTVGGMMTQRVAEPGRLAGMLYRRHRIVPMLPPETPFLPYTEERHTTVRLVDGRFACLAGDAAAQDPGALPVPDLESLRATLVREVERNVAPTIGPIAARSHLSPRAIWALIAYGAVVSIAESMADAGDAPGAAAELEALMAIGGPLADPPSDAHLEGTEFGPRLILRMGACCRIYRWPGGREKCIACPTRTPAERIALQAVEHVDD